MGMTTNDLIWLLIIYTPSIAMLVRITVKHNWHGMTYADAIAVISAEAMIYPAGLYWICIMFEYLSQCEWMNKRIGDK